MAASMTACTLPTEIPDGTNQYQKWEVINVNPTDFTGMLTANPNFCISDKGGRWSSVFKSWGLEADVQTEKHGAKKSGARLWWANFFVGKSMSVSQSALKENLGNRSGCQRHPACQL